MDTKVVLIDTLQTIKEAQDFIEIKEILLKLIGGKKEMKEKTVLNLLRKEGPLTIKEIEKTTGKKYTTLYMELKKLEDESLVEKIQLTNNRVAWKIPKLPGEKTVLTDEPPEPEPEPETISTGEANIKLPQTNPQNNPEETCSRLKTIILHDMIDTNNQGNCIDLHLYLLKSIQTHTSENEYGE